MSVVSVLTWQETIELARFPQLSVTDLEEVPAKIVEEALVIIRARTNE